MQIDGNAPDAPLLALEQVRVRGTTGFELGPVSLVLHQGETLGIVGRTGSGKSLLLRSIAGLQRRVDGNLRWPQAQTTTMQKTSALPRVGLAFQRDALLANEDALENVALAARGLGLSTPKERAWQLLEAFGLREAAHKRPAELSGGMRKRVGLARALVVEPDLLLCDDTTAGLDPATEMEILDRIFSYLTRKEGAALLFATHSLDAVVPRMGRVGVLAEGRLAFLDSPLALAKSTRWAAFAPRIQAHRDDR